VGRPDIEPRDHTAVVIVRAAAGWSSRPWNPTMTRVF